MGDERFSNVLPELRKLHVVLAITSSIHILLSLPYIFPKSFLSCGKLKNGNVLASTGHQQVIVAGVGVSYVVFNTLLYHTKHLHPRWLWISSVIGMLYWALSAALMSLGAIIFASMLPGYGPADCGMSKAKCIYCTNALPFLWAAVLWPMAITYGMLWRMGRRVQKQLRDESLGRIGTQPGAIRLDG